MDESMQDLESRFDKIKNHKPRAPKKLAELGDLLARVFKINPQRANEMWDYITVLNISDDISYAKYYVAQVFMKLSEKLTDSELAFFVTLSPDRMGLMIKQGYTGSKQWDMLKILIHGFLVLEMSDKALECAQLFFDQFGGIFSNSTNLFRATKIITKLCVDCIGDDVEQDSANRLLSSLKTIDAPDIATVVSAVEIIELAPDESSLEARLYVARKCKEPVEFFELLWQAKDLMSQDELKEQWVEYLAECDDTDVWPHGDVYDDAKCAYIDSKEGFYVGLEKNADALLGYYFSRPKMYQLEKMVVKTWIFEGDWDRFVRYVSQMLSETKGETPDQTLMHVLGEFIDACFFGSGWDRKDSFGRSYKDAMSNSSQSFARSLARITAALSGCTCYETFKQVVCQFLYRLNGNHGFLEEVGIYEAVENRTPKARLIDYAHSFLRSGRGICPPKEIEYQLIMESFNAEGVYPSCTWDWDESLEDMFYDWATNDDLTKLYFEHYPSESAIRANLLFACALRGDIDRAMALVGSMPVGKSAANEEDSLTDKWDYGRAQTIKYLIDRCDHLKDYERQVAGIAEDMRQFVRALASKVMPTLSERSRLTLSSNLLKFEGTKKLSTSYLNEILAKTNEYTSFPYSAETRRNVNELSLDIARSFEGLSSMGRLDIIAFIMTKIAAVKDQLGGVQFPTWMSMMSHDLSGSELLTLFKNYPDIFEEWISTEDLMEFQVIEIAGEIEWDGDSVAFGMFKSMVVTHYGYVEGLDDCFSAWL